jgi:hypothetical protein
MLPRSKQYNRAALQQEKIMYISLPPTPKAFAAPKNRRPALALSAVSPPSLTTQTSYASRKDTCGRQSSKATALLARVASSPPPKPPTPAASPILSPSVRSPEFCRNSSPVFANEHMGFSSIEDYHCRHMENKQGEPPELSCMLQEQRAHSTMLARWLH